MDWHRRRVGSFPVTSVERSLVDAWGSADGVDRAVLRAAVITAVRERMCTTQALVAELAVRPRLPGRRELRELVDLLAAGCRSELEIWGCLAVLRGPGMPAFTQQRVLRVGTGTFHLDAAYDDALLAVEMDGAAWHGSRPQRERDIRRDALVATVGWQTLRFGYRRLTAEPEVCQAEIRAVHETRRRLLHPERVR